MDTFTNLEIKEQIDRYRQIMRNSSRTQFVLLPEIEEMANKIKELQEVCPHEFKDGRCIYCGKEQT